MIVISQFAGGWEGSYSDNIYELNYTTEQWTNVGNLLESRDLHAVSVVNDAESLWQYCK